MTMKTVLSIAQGMKYRANDASVPTALASTTDPDALQIRQLLYDVCEELRQAACWSQQKKTYSFETVASQSSYQLPPDFYAVSPSTEYDEESRLQIPGLLDSDAAYRLYRLNLASGTYAYRLMGFDENTASSGHGQFEIIPTPAAAGTVTFEYLTSSLFVPRHWAASTVFAAGSYCNAGGRVYYSSAGGTSGANVPTHTTGSASDGGVTWAIYTSSYETIIADTDLCLFDADIVKLGLRAKYYEDNAKAEAEYRGKISAAVARMTPSIRGSFSRRKTGPRYAVPYGSWSI